MDYEKNYYDYALYVKQLVANGIRPKNKREYYLWKKIQPSLYYEFHHIEMECFGGDYSQENLIPLTAREHYLAHYLLWKFKRCQETALSWKWMNTFSNETKTGLNSKLFESVKLQVNEDIKPMLGKKHTEQTKNRARESKLRMFDEFPEKRDLYRRSFRYALSVRIARLKQFSDNLPRDINVTSVSGVYEFIESTGIKMGFQRQIKVHFKCTLCSKDTVVCMKSFTERGRDTLECKSCRTSKRMKENNPSHRRNLRSVCAASFI